METWRVVSIDRNYEVSSEGSVRRAVGGRGATVGHVLTPHDNGRGYLMVHLGLARSQQVHTLVAREFLGPRPKGKTIDHLNGDKYDNRAANLEYVRHSVNVQRHYDGPMGDEQRAKLRAYAASPDGKANKRKAGALGGGSNRVDWVTEELVKSMHERDGMAGWAIAKELGVGYKVIRSRLGRL